MIAMLKPTSTLHGVVGKFDPRSGPLFPSYSTCENVGLKSEKEREKEGNEQ